MKTQIKNKGSITMEILLAFTILILCLSAVILVGFGNQKITVDSEINIEALSKAGKVLEDARALSRQDYPSVTATTGTETVNGLQYTKTLSINDITQCKKQAMSTITWTTEGRSQKIELVTYLSDIAGAMTLGGDCIGEPGPNWNNPKKFASDNMSPGKSTAIDISNRIAYLGSDKNPYFYIADTRSATLGQTSGLFVTFTNNFTTDDTINSLDAVHNSTTDKNYVFAVLASSTAQLIVIDTTDIYNPTLVAKKRLSACVAGSFPEGWRLYYYKDRIYLTTRYTAGPEFHIFNVSDPTNPVEFSIGSVGCKGLDLGNTVNGMVVAEQKIGGITKRFIYFATDESDKELRVFDITSSINPIEVTTANQDLSGAQNGQSVYIIGNKLFFGRQSTPSGPDLYVYNISDPFSGLPLLGSKDITTGVLQIRVSGKFAFLATPQSNKEFQVWDISDLSNISLIKAYNFGNIVEQGVDYEPDWIYATGQATPNFQMLYNQ
ncbi:MAG: hypothetical protein WAX85_01325 [Minisyncoccia bacterium]